MLTHDSAKKLLANSTEPRYNDTMEANAADKKLLKRCARGPVSFTHAIDLSGKVQTRVIRSSMRSGNQKHLHRLALAGLVFEHVTGCGGHGEPPEHTVTYTPTALGRAAIGLHKAPPLRTRGSTALTDEQLAKEGIE